MDDLSGGSCGIQSPGTPEKQPALRAGESEERISVTEIVMPRPLQGVPSTTGPRTTTRAPAGNELVSPMSE